MKYENSLTYQYALSVWIYRMSVWDMGIHYQDGIWVWDTGYSVSGWDIDRISVWNMDSISVGNISMGYGYGI